MKKMVYVAWCNHIGGEDRVIPDSISFDVAECRVAAIKNREKMSSIERAGCEHYIIGNKINVLDGQSARVAYEEWMLGQTSRPDAEYYEEVYIENDYKVDVKIFKTNYHIWISRNHLCIMSRLMSTDGFLYVIDKERYNAYIDEGNDDEGNIILVSDAAEADVGMVSDTLDKLGITLPSGVMNLVQENIEAIYRTKSI